MVGADKTAMGNYTQLRESARSSFASENGGIAKTANSERNSGERRFNALPIRNRPIAFPIAQARLRAESVRLFPRSRSARFAMRSRAGARIRRAENGRARPRSARPEY